MAQTPIHESALYGWQQSLFLVLSRTVLTWSFILIERLFDTDYCGDVSYLAETLICGIHANPANRIRLLWIGEPIRLQAAETIA
jgi:hypothetical protein